MTPTEPMELDEKALEAATVAVRMETGLFGWHENITPDEEVLWHSSGHHSADRNRARAAITAYLSATPDKAGQVAIPFIKE